MQRLKKSIRLPAAGAAGALSQGAADCDVSVGKETDTSCPMPGLAAGEAHLRRCIQHEMVCQPKLNGSNQCLDQAKTCEGSAVNIPNIPLWSDKVRSLLRHPFLFSLTFMVLTFWGSAVWVDNAFAAQSTTYTYDALGRLISATDPEGVTMDYVYDKAGNLKSVKRRASPLPTIESLIPSSGSVGQAVKLLGTNFKPVAQDNTIKFNGVQAVVSLATFTELQTVVPQGATTGPVTVTTAAGTGTSPQPFTVLPSAPPAITGVSPGVVEPGAAFTIAGSNFFPQIAGNQVVINGAPATITAATDLNLTATAPVASGGKVRVTTQAGTATSTADLFIVPQPGTAAEVVATGRLTVDGPKLPLQLAANRVGLLLFEGAAGLSGLRARLADMTLTTGLVALYGPDGQQIGSSQSFVSTTGVIQLPSLVDTGTHTLNVLAGATGGAVSVALGLDVERSIVVDAPASTIEIVNPLQRAMLRFQGTLGAQLVLDVTNVLLSQSSATFVLREPDGSVIYTGTATSAGLLARLPVLPVTGEYSLEISPGGGGTGTLTLALNSMVDLDLGSITVDQTRTVTTQLRGQAAKLSFAASVGDRLGLSFSSSTFAGGLVVNVRRPDGSLFSTSTVAGTSGAASVPDITVAGNYVIELLGVNLTPGSVSVRLVSVAVLDAGAIAVGASRSVAIEFAGQQATLTFEAAAGDQLGINWTSSSFQVGGDYQITGPGGTAFVAATFISLGTPVRLPRIQTTGTYTLRIVPRSNGTGSLSLKLWSDVLVGAVPIPGSTSISFTDAGQQATLTFEAKTGDQLGINWTASSLQVGGNFHIYGPGGATLVPDTSITPGVPVRFPQIQTAGTYTLRIVPRSNGTGNVSLKLWSDVPPVSVPVPGSASISITDSGQQATLTFAATAGDQLGINWTASSLQVGGNFHIYGPGGATLVPDTSITPGVPVRFPQIQTAGTYTLRIVPRSNGTGNVSLKLWSDVPPVSVPVPGSASISITDSGQQATLTFAATAGDQLGINWTASNFQLGGDFRVAGPDGSSFVAATFINTTVPVRIPQVQMTGTYSLRMIPRSNGTGIASLKIWSDFMGALAISQLSPLSVAIDNPGQQARLTFSAAAGDLLALTLSSVSFPSGGSVQILGPGGAALVPSANISAPGITLNIPAIATAGTHTVVIIPNSQGTGSLAARLTTR